MTPYFDNNFNLCFKASDEEKIRLLGDFSGLYNKYEPMAAWFNNPDVPQEQKDTYNFQLINVMQSMSFITQLMRRCGISEFDIEEHTKIPF